MTEYDELPPGACLDLGWLFDSTHPDHHERAKALCDVCPRFEWCEKQYLAYSSQHHVIPTEGTWAGRLLLDERAAKVRPTCGTAGGAVAHKRAKERVCEACADARAAYDLRKREEKAAKK